MAEPRNIVLIIGNGFDLDLGLKTSYKDFWESDFCPKNYPAPIIKHLGEKWPEKLESVKWYDLENELLNYYKGIEKSRRIPDVIDVDERKFLKAFNPEVSASGYYSEFNHQIESLFQKELIDTNPLCPTYLKIPMRDDLLLSSVVRDYKALELIKDGLIKYLNSQNDASLNENAIATSVLYAITESINSGNSIKIYDFNYTQLPYGYNGRFKENIHYVHGTTMTGKIIIGTKDYEGYNESFDFLQKSFDPNFNPPAVVYDLLAADDVIIFGHSLGVNDSQYFKAFFKRQSSPESPVKKNITVFTKDTASELALKRSLQQMTDTNLSSLFGLNTIKVYRTDELYRKPVLFKEFLERYISDTRHVVPIIQQLDECRIGH